MPNNTDPGMLEDLLMEMFQPEKKDLHEHVSAFVSGAKDLGASYKDAHRAKAIVGSWIAIEAPGEAQWRKPVLKKLDFKHPKAVALANWAKALFDL